MAMLKKGSARGAEVCSNNTFAPGRPKTLVPLLYSELGLMNKK
jgi:hypothetical protein